MLCLCIKIHIEAIRKLISDKRQHRRLKIYIIVACLSKIGCIVWYWKVCDPYSQVGEISCRS